MATSGTCFTYLIVNKLNGKQYFGLTKSPVSERFKQHAWCALGRRGNNFALSSAIRKYGAAAFAAFELKGGLPRDEAGREERRLIATYGAEYNMTTGGETARGAPGGMAGRRHSPETRQLISERKRGKPRPPLPDSVVDVFRNNMRRAAARRAMPVVCVDDGKWFPSARAAEIHYGFSKGSVNVVCHRKNNRRLLYGKRFDFAEKSA